MATGTIKWFNNKKGYGFIVRESDGKDVYVHAVDIEQAGFEKDLKTGDRVQFDIMQTQKGVKAIQVKCLKE
jgi:CspA family cold shock protein